MASTAAVHHHRNTMSRVGAKLFRTDTAETASQVPLMLADVAVMGAPSAETNSRGHGMVGNAESHRIQASRHDQGNMSDFGTTMVNWPGQNAFCQ